MLSPGPAPFSAHPPPSFCCGRNAKKHLSERGERRELRMQAKGEKSIRETLTRALKTRHGVIKFPPCKTLRKKIGVKIVHNKYSEE